MVILCKICSPTLTIFIFLIVKNVSLVLLMLVLQIICLHHPFQVHCVYLAMILHACPRILPLICRFLFLWNPYGILQLQTLLFLHPFLQFLMWPLLAIWWLPEGKQVYSNYSCIMLWLFCLLLGFFRLFLLSKSLEASSLLQNTLNGSRLWMMKFKFWRKMIRGFLYLVLRIIMWFVVTRFSKQSFALMGLLSAIRHILWLKDFLRFMVWTLATPLDCCVPCYGQNHFVLGRGW